MTTIPFTKMVGTGNDFVVIDASRHPFRAPKTEWRAISRALCDRRNGVGADGLLVLESSKTADIKMRVWNPDGSEAPMCGNGARCVALYLKRAAENNGRVGTGRATPVTIETVAGLLSAQVHGDRVTMRMTNPTELQLGLSLDMDGRRVRCAFVNTGVPHAVVPVEALDDVEVDELGRALRHHRCFSPRGANIDFIQPDAKRPGRLRVRTYERGVEGETPACGTGVVASAIVHALLSEPPSAGKERTRATGRTRAYTIEVETRSRDLLTVSFRVRSAGGERRITDVVLEGAAQMVFDGSVVWPLRRV